MLKSVAQIHNFFDIPKYDLLLQIGFKKQTPIPHKVNKVGEICDVVKVVNLKLFYTFILTVKFNHSYDFVSYIHLLTNVNHVSEQIYIFADNCIRSINTHTCLIRSMNAIFSSNCERLFCR